LISNARRHRAQHFREACAIAPYNLVLFVLLLIAGAIFLGELSAGQDRKNNRDLDERDAALRSIHPHFCGSAGL